MQKYIKLREKRKAKYTNLVIFGEGRKIKIDINVFNGQQILNK